MNTEQAEVKEQEAEMQEHKACDESCDHHEAPQAQNDQDVSPYSFANAFVANFQLETKLGANKLPTSHIPTDEEIDEAYEWRRTSARLQRQFVGFTHEQKSEVIRILKDLNFTIITNVQSPEGHYYHTALLQ